MARHLRIQFEGAWYHVMNRGAAKKDIYHSDKEKLIFLELLERIHHRYQIEIHGYCLMSNHYHLLIKTQHANLSEAIKYLNGVFVQKKNALNEVDGPLFRGRFKSIVVDKNEYLLQLSRYIHLNPVKALICEKPWNYTWSSCKSYIGAASKPYWLNIDEVLEIFKTDNQGRHEKYIKFLEEGIDEKTRKFFKKNQIVYGNDDFVKQIVQTHLNQHALDPEIPEEKDTCSTQLPSIEKVIYETAKYYNVPVNKIMVGIRGKENISRDVAIYLLVQLCHKNLTQIADYFKNIKKSGISKIYNKILRKIKSNVRIKNDIEQIVLQVG